LEDTTVYFARWYVADNFLQFFGVPIIEGNDFLNTSSTAFKQVIVNKELVKMSGKSDVTGKELRTLEIIGVIDDVNFEDLHHSIRPMGFVKEIMPGWRNDFMGQWLYLKIAGNDVPKTIAYIKSVWAKFSNRPFELNFLYTHLDGLYKKENDLAQLLKIFCIVAIIIAIMGVYGLISLNSKQKEKEIALRKISGASIKDILILLNRNVFIQLVIAFIVATPLAYYIVGRWLESFAYKIQIHWWVFVLSWLFMGAITALTICLQTYRTAIKNPVEALKNE
jgi:putative ABC transport system permease protein